MTRAGAASNGALDHAMAVSLHDVTPKTSGNSYTTSVDATGTARTTGRLSSLSHATSRTSTPSRTTFPSSHPVSNGSVQDRKDTTRWPRAHVGRGRCDPRGRVRAGLRRAGQPAERVSGAGLGPPRGDRGSTAERRTRTTPPKRSPLNLRKQDHAQAVLHHSTDVTRGFRCSGGADRWGVRSVARGYRGTVRLPGDGPLGKRLSGDGPLGGRLSGARPVGGAVSRWACQAVRVSGGLVEER
jgi:hypothetical protein